jgi:HlyD family secretion protein
MAKTNTTIFTRVRRLPKKVWIPLVILLLAGLGGGGWYYWNTRNAAGSISASEQLQTAQVRQGNIELSTSGTATLNPRLDATFGFRATGQIVLLKVKIGDHVKAGEMLAALDDAAAQLTLTQAKRALQELSSPAAIQTQMENVANAKVALKTAHDSLAYYISPDVLYYEERVAQAQSDLQKAQDQETASPSQENAKKVQDAKTALEWAQSGLLYAQGKYDGYLTDTFTFKDVKGREVIYVFTPPTLDQVAAARAAYAVAKQTLADEQAYLTALLTGAVPPNSTGAKVTTFEQAQQTVAAAKDSLDGTHLVAPIDGTVTALTFGLGDSVGSGSSASITISNLDQPFVVDFYVDETEWKNVAVGYAANVTFDILSDKTFSGKVISIDPILTTQNGALYVHGQIQLDPFTGTSLPMGTSGSAVVIAGQAQNAVLVPIAALHMYSPGQYAVFVMTNGKPVLRMVTIGLQDLVNAEVKTGLKAGETVSTGIVQTK